MRFSFALVLIVLVASSRLAWADDNEATFDGIVADSAAVPRGGTVRLTGSVGTFGPAEGVSGEVGIQWTMIRTLTLSVAGLLESNQAYDRISQATPTVALRWQLLAQDRFGVDLTSTLRFKTIGFDPNAGELELGVAVGRTFGRWVIVGNLVGGRDTQAVGGTDLEVKGLAEYGVASIVSVGVEGRFRTGRDPVNFPVFGSAWDLVGGARAAVRLGPIRIQGLVGIGGGAGPNAQLLGLGKPAPCGMLNVTGDIT